MQHTNDLFHRHYPKTKALNARRVTLEKQVQQLETKLADIRTQLKAVDAQAKVCTDALGIIKTRPFFSRQLPDDVKLSIVGGVGHWGSQKVACVCRDFRVTVAKARELRMYGEQGLSISAGSTHTVMCIMGRVYTCGGSYDDDEDDDAEDDELKSNRSHLGHGGSVNELVPRLVEALMGVNVLGTTTGDAHTVVWTDEWKAYSFGNGDYGQLGHGVEEDELVPRLVSYLLIDTTSS